ncbi:hypothetical protein A20C1_10379 [marine actinobacterium PHSC20C1]|nr:hypothetical protein A20C1_10379 [marine actinobacterium PHSC20C1]
MQGKNEVWSDDEVRRAVESYLAMLKLEIEGIPFVKSHANAKLRESLNNRSKGSVEFKFQNISAVMVRSHRTPIRGYKPAANAQALLAAAVSEALTANPALDAAAAARFDPKDWLWFNL